MALIDSEAAAICLDCAEEAFARWLESAWVCRVAPSSLIAEPWMVVTSSRSASTAKLMESAIAPVMSSVTVACTVRSPSARLDSSSSSRRMACWFRSFWRVC